LNSFKIQITVRSLSYSALSPEQSLLSDQAKDVAHRAYAPYSHFRVGTAVALINGTIVTGSNQENAAYPSGMCAERVALYAVGAQYSGVTIKALAIFSLNNSATDHIISPCGACRQVMLQSERRQLSPIEIMLCGPDSVLILDSAECLLPLPFP